MCNVMDTGKTKVCAMLWVQVKLRYMQLCNVMESRTDFFNIMTESSITFQGLPHN